MDLSAEAQKRGIQADYIDAHGRPRRTDPDALKAIVEALPPRTPYRFVDGPISLRSGREPRTRLTDSVRLPLRWTVTCKGRAVQSGETAEPEIGWPASLEPGLYHVALADASGATEEVPLIVAQERAFGGRFDRTWILAVQLYSIRSERNWGIGDFTDLARMVELAHELGAAGVGLNPLHVLFDDRPASCSPYSPNSRLFLNPLYIDVEAIPEFEAAEFRKTNSAEIASTAGDLVDYAAVSALKWRGLRAAFERFTRHASKRRRQAFEKFRAAQGPLLRHFACFEVLRHRHSGPWWEWPEQWRRPDEARLAELAREADGREVEFAEFVQWVADSQLHGARQVADRLGMKVGLYLDVAVGVQSDGFDAWNEQVAISRELAVGAPPDVLNTAGQDWGLAGYNAGGLEKRSFEPFAEMLRASMRHAGAIRLDHVLGLQRLYLVPRGFKPDNGAYVQMPFEALLGAVAVESNAHNCIVIGEDLGTVPDGFRETMQSWGMLSYVVMMFERDDQGRFKDVGSYAPNALVTLNTHDLSTYAGWRGFADLKTKRDIGIDPGESDEARWHALAMLDNALGDRGIHRNDLYSVLSLLAKSPSRLLSISIEDLLGIPDQPNIPGTVDEHPNWRRRLPVALGELLGRIDIDALKAATVERAGS